MKTKKFISSVTAIVAALALSATANAIPMMGSVEYNLDASAFTFDGSAVDFLAIPSGKVNNANGDFSGLLGENVVHTDFTSDLVGAPITPLVLIGGFTFGLDILTHYSYSTTEEGESFLNASGNGYISTVNFDDTPATWTFSATEGATSNNYSATITTTPQSVPDGGSTLASLGLAIGVLLVARRRKRFQRA